MSLKIILENYERYVNREILFLKGLVGLVGLVGL
jgi:hypothetical protein